VTTYPQTGALGHDGNRFDVAVVGAGAAGLAAALAFAREGFATMLAGPLDARADGRTVALMSGSVKFLKALGVWESIVADAAPLQTMQLIDDTASLFRPPPVSFHSTEIGLEAFGWNIENRLLVQHLAAAARREPHLVLTEGMARPEDGNRLTLPGDEIVTADLIVAADGRNSALRERAGIRTRSWSYPQAAVTTILAHGRDHRETSTEFHTREGPFTLVPLPGRRSSLVWVMNPHKAKSLAGLDDGALASMIERQAQSMLGSMTIAAPRGMFPMTGLSVVQYQAAGLALVGEAAHVFPPIGAQGLNLGFRDVAALLDAVVDGREAGLSAGSPENLAIYQRGRDLDVRLRTAAVDGLNRTLLTDILPADFLRGAGLLALSAIRPLRRTLMREGVQPHIGAPRLMR
jgi:2-octaprenyl-6-methoxyphenol hydroxylase